METCQLTSLSLHFKKLLIQYLLFVHVVVMVTLTAQSGCQPHDVPAVQLENSRLLETSIVVNGSETFYFICTVTFTHRVHSVYIFLYVSMGYITYHTYMSTCTHFHNTHTWHIYMYAHNVEYMMSNTSQHYKVIMIILF